MELKKDEATFTMVDWFKKVVKENYANFDGRARRSEYWYFVLANFLLVLSISIAGGIVVGLLNLESLSFIFGGLYALVSLGLIIPSLAVAVRRLHDVGRSGWFLLIALIPLAGLVLLYFYVQDSEPGTNQWGPNPKEVSSE